MFYDKSILLFLSFIVIEQAEQVKVSHHLNKSEQEIDFTTLLLKRRNK